MHACWSGRNHLVSGFSKVSRSTDQVPVLCCCRITSCCSLIRTLAHKKLLVLRVTKTPTDLWVIEQLKWSAGKCWLVWEFWLANELAPPLQPSEQRVGGGPQGPESMWECCWEVLESSEAKLLWIKKYLNLLCMLLFSAKCLCAALQQLEATKSYRWLFCESLVAALVVRQFLMLL